MTSNIWNGNGNWNTDLGDWSLSVAPTAADDVLIETGTATLSSAGVAKNVYIDNTANQTLFITGATASLSAATLTAFGNFRLDTNGGDGGSTVTISGAFNNWSNAVLGNSSLSKATTMTVGSYGSFPAYGNLNIWGNETLGTTNQMTLVVNSAAPTTLVGQIFIHGDSDVEYASGGIQSIGSGAELQIDGQQSRFSIGAGTTNSALTGLANNYGTLDLEGDWSTGPGGTSVNITNGFYNAGALQLDIYGGDGASQMTVGGTLTNVGALTIGNSSLSSLGTQTTMTVGNLVNTGTINLWGNETLGTTNQATLQINAAAPTTWTGGIYIHGDSDVIFASGGINTIAAGGEIQIDGKQARYSIGAGTTNSALSTLATNYGTFDEEGDWSTGPGGASVTTNAAFTNYNTFDLDIYGNDGASSFTDAGLFTNDDYVQIGNDTLSANSTLTVNNLANNGTVYVDSQRSPGANPQAALYVGAAAPSTSTGYLRIAGNSLIQYASGTINAIGPGAEIELDGNAASIADAGGGQNSALSTLSGNSGLLLLRGDNGFGSGVTLTTTTAFTNSATVDIDSYSGSDGGSTVTFGGALTNNATMTIGNLSLSGATTVSAASLTNAGTLTILGNIGNGGSMASLKIAGAAPAIVTNSLRVGGAGLLNFGSGTGFTSIANGGDLELDGAGANISIGTNGPNSALTKLASNSGTFYLRSNSDQGQGAVVLTTTTSFTNSGTTYIDSYYGNNGGTQLTIGGALVNNGALDIGSLSLSANTTVSAASLTDNNSLILLGNYNNTGALATLNVAGAAPAVVSAYLRVGGTATLAYGSGTINGVAHGGWLELDGAAANISTGGGAQNSALAKISYNNGTFYLRSNSDQGQGALTVSTASSFTNTGTTYIDSYYGNNGGTTFAIAGALINNGTFDIGTLSLSANTTVSAATLADNNSLTLLGNYYNAGALATLNIAGAAPGSIGAFLRVGGTATLHYGSGTINGVLHGGDLEVDGGMANISSGAGAQNSALTNVSYNNGTFYLRSNSDQGQGNVVVTTGTYFVNNGATYIDGYYGGNGGTSFTIGSTLTNNSNFDIGTLSLSANTFVQAAALANHGDIELLGNYSNAGALATLNITGASIGAVTGRIRLGGSSLLKFGSGNGIGGVANGGWFELDGAGSDVQVGLSGARSGLKTFSYNNGTFWLRSNSDQGQGAIALTTTSGFTNTYNVTVDGNYYGDGGTAWSIGAYLINSGTFSLGTYGLSANSSVSAKNITNQAGTINVTGGNGHLATLSSASTFLNYATLNVNTGGQVTTTGAFTQYAGNTTIGGTLTSNGYTQYSGLTTVNGSLASTIVNIKGGGLAYNSALTAGSQTTTIDMSGGAGVQIYAGASASQTFAFQDATSSLQLFSPTTFNANVTGFTAGDTIDLRGQGAAASLSYSGGVLSVLDGSSNVLESFKLSGGAYTTSSFSLENDLLGGKLIYV